MLAEAIKLGDYFARQNEKGIFTPRLDIDWDSYMGWKLIAYSSRNWVLRVMHAGKGNPWKCDPFYQSAIRTVDFPWDNTPYIGNSPNNYAQWASLLMPSRHVFGKLDWLELGNKTLHHYSTVEQTPDGYWGECRRTGPTTGYDYVTLTQIAVYWEFSYEPAALKALRRSTDFHMYFTYPDGTPVDDINNRNRYWGAPVWG